VHNAAEDYHTLPACVGVLRKTAVQSDNVALYTLLVEVAEGQRSSLTMWLSTGYLEKSAVGCRFEFEQP
jgi:hypothetical protein